MAAAAASVVRSKVRMVEFPFAVELASVLVGPEHLIIGVQEFE